MSDHQIGPVGPGPALPTPDGEGPKNPTFWAAALDPAALARAGRLSLQAGRASRLRRFLLTIALFLPSIIAVFYFTVVASDRYVSSASFIVRKSAKSPSLGGGLGSVLQIAGLSKSQEDMYAVHDFIMSRDAVNGLEQSMDLKAMFGVEGSDFVARYPSLFYGGSEETFFDYYRHMVTVSFDSTTGISHLDVDAFRADDAQKIAAKLLELGENLVNNMNRTIQRHALDFAEDDVAEAQDRVRASQALLTAYRNHQLTIDPKASGLALSDLTARLSSQLAVIQTRIAELEASAPNSPELRSLKARAEALQAQLDRENARIADQGSGIAQQIADYEGLMTAHQFNIEDLGRALAALESARNDVRKQQLFLETIVQPSMPDSSRSPKRLQSIGGILATNIIIVLIGVFFWAGWREHRATIN